MQFDPQSHRTSRRKILEHCLPLMRNQTGPYVNFHVVTISLELPLPNEDYSQQSENQFYDFEDFQLHSLALSTDKNCANRSFFNQLSLCTGGNGYIYRMDSETPATVLTNLQNILEAIHTPCISTLAMGHLNTSFELFPSPSLCLWTRTAKKNGAPFTFPNIFSVIGFLPLRGTFCIEAISRFALLPVSDLLRQADVSQLNGTNTDGHHQESAADGLSPFNPLLLSLVDSLWKTQKVAVVHIHDNWYGILSPNLQPDIDTDSEDSTPSKYLVMAVLSENTKLPYFGLPSGLLTNDSIQRQQLQVVNDLSEFSSIAPCQNVYPFIHSVLDKTPSYLHDFDSADDTAPLCDASSISLELSKLSYLITSLPESRSYLFSQAERLRKFATYHSLPDFMDCLADFLECESAGSALGDTVLTKLITTLRSKDIPVNWTSGNELELDATRPKKTRTKAKQAK